MRIGLNVPTTYRIAPSLLMEIGSLGFEVVRTDVPPDGNLEGFVYDYVDAPVVPLFLLHDVARNEPLLDSALPKLGRRFMVQVWNEPPGMDKINLSQYIDGILAVHHDCRARGFTGEILMGGLANPGRENRAWLRTAIKAMPRDIVVDEHRYSYKTQDDRLRPWPPFSGRRQEASALKDIADQRPVSLTETGWHTAEETIGLPDTYPRRQIRLTDEQCRDNLVKDFELYETAGYELVCVYQLNDGAGTTHLDKFGIRRVDGSWKPQADAVRMWRAQNG